MKRKRRCSVKEDKKIMSEKKEECTLTKKTEKVLQWKMKKAKTKYWKR